MAPFRSRAFVKAGRRQTPYKKRYSWKYHYVPTIWAPDYSNVIDAILWALWLGDDEDYDWRNFWY